jgi:hypothetical protein
MADGTGTIDDLTAAVKECKRTVDDLEDRLSQARVMLGVASANLNRALGTETADGRKAYRDRDAIAKIDVVLMLLSFGAERMATVAAAARRLGRSLPASVVYQQAYQRLTDQAGGGKRKLTGAGRERLKAVLARPECAAFYEKVRQTLEEGK